MEIWSTLSFLHNASASKLQRYLRHNLPKKGRTTAYAYQLIKHMISLQMQIYYEKNELYKFLYTSNVYSQSIFAHTDETCGTVVNVNSHNTDKVQKISRIEDIRMTSG